MAAIVFRYTGLVTPEMIRKTEPIPYRMDTPLYEAIRISVGKARSGVAQFMEAAVEGNVQDLDAVLMAAMDCRERLLTRTAMASMVQVKTDVADTLKAASEFLKEKQYSRMGRGTVMVACAILEAEKRRIIGSADQPDKPIVSTPYNDDPEDDDNPPRIITRKPRAKVVVPPPPVKVKGKPGPKPGLKERRLKQVEVAAKAAAAKKVPVKLVKGKPKGKK